MCSDGSISAPAARAVGEQAWQWIVRHERRFLAAPDDGQVPRRLKLAGELALVAGTLRDEVEEATPLLERAWSALGDGEQLIARVRAQPVVAAIYWPFCVAGCRSDALERTLSTPDWLRGRPLAPFARFAIGATLALLGVAPPWDEAAVERANDFFAAPSPETPAIRAVLLAHALMWRTRMGRRRATPDDRARHWRVSPAWHALLAGRGLLDPLGEMIIADACVSRVPPARSLQLLRAYQRHDGALPQRGGDDTGDFDEVYHPTCVAALAGLLAARAMTDDNAIDERPMTRSDQWQSRIRS